MVTGQELIDWIKHNHAEDAIVEVAFRDDGGMYYGTDKDVSPLIVGENVTLPYIDTADYKRLIL